MFFQEDKEGSNYGSTSTNLDSDSDYHSQMKQIKEDTDFDNALSTMEKQPLLSQSSKQSSSSSSSSSNTKSNTDINSNKDSNKINPADETGGNTLVVSFLLMVFFQLGNRIFGRLETYPMHNYPMFMNILSVIMYIPLSFMYIIPVQILTDWITPEQRAIPQWTFMVMGFLDSIAGIMAMFAINYIPSASMIVLVQQSAIPISMIMSSMTLGARYTRSQYAGAGIVFGGIVAVLIPKLMGAGDDSADGSGNYPGSSQLLWYTVLVLSGIPMCLSSVYKEKELGALDIDVVYLNGWVAIYQFIFAIPLCIPTAFVIGMDLADIMPNMSNGWKCYLGENSVGLHENLPPDDCSMSPFYVTSYLGFNLVYNILMIVILKHGSANILWLASTIIVPLSNVAFSLQIMPGRCLYCIYL